ncbi:hypothetical protein PO124_28085 [Bacillus licheniformis]|nr:hypothetical protein [Bacillus licheniformis]
MNEEGEFDYVILPAEEIIAVYDSTKYHRLYMLSGFMRSKI